MKDARTQTRQKERSPSLHDGSAPCCRRRRCRGGGCRVVQLDIVDDKAFILRDQGFREGDEGLLCLYYDAPQAQELLVSFSDALVAEKEGFIVQDTCSCIGKGYDFFMAIQESIR